MHLTPRGGWQCRFLPRRRGEPSVERHVVFRASHPTVTGYACLDRQLLVVQQVTALAIVHTNAGRDKTETSFTAYYVPLDARLTATRVAPRKGRLPPRARPPPTSRPTFLMLMHWQRCVPGTRVHPRVRRHTGTCKIGSATASQPAASSARSAGNWHFMPVTDSGQIWPRCSNTLPKSVCIMRAPPRRLSSY